MAESKENDQRLRKEKFNRRLDRRERLRRRKRDMTRVRYVGRGINPAQVRRLRALKRDSDPSDTFFENVVDTGPDFVIGRKIQHDYGPGFSYEQVRTTPKLESTIRDLLTPSPIPKLEESLGELLTKYDDERTKLEEKELEELPYGQNQLGLLMFDKDGKLSRTKTKEEAGLLDSPSARPRPPAVKSLSLPPLQNGECEDSELRESPSGNTPGKTKPRTPVFTTPRKFQSVIL